MYRTDNSTSATTLPAPGAVGPNPNSYFSLNNPAGGSPSTVVDADWMNAVQEELCNAITGAGITLSKTVRTQLSTAISTLIAVETTRAEAVEALKAPISNPAFAGNGSITGNFTTDGAATVIGAATVGSLTTAGVIESTSTSGSAIYAPNGGVYAAGLATTGTGAAAIGTGGLTVGGSENVAGNITSTGGNITASVGTVTGVNLQFTNELYGPYFSVYNGNVNATSGTVTALALTATSTVTGAIITSAGQINNPWFDVNGSSGVVTVPFTLEGGATVYGALSLYSAGVGEARWECQVPSGYSSIALESNVGIVGGATILGSSSGGYLYSASGQEPNPGLSGYFGLITGVAAVASGFLAQSDSRLKDDQARISAEDGIRFIRRCKPKRWKWNTAADKGKVGTGYVAQELIVAGYDHLVFGVPHDLDPLPERTDIIDGEEITSEAGIKLSTRYDDSIAYLHAGSNYLDDRLAAALGRIEVLENRLALAGI
jgi:hypothetical protein